MISRRDRLINKRNLHTDKVMHDILAASKSAAQAFLSATRNANFWDGDEGDLLILGDEIDLLNVGDVGVCGIDNSGWWTCIQIFNFDRNAEVEFCG